MAPSISAALLALVGTWDGFDVVAISTELAPEGEGDVFGAEAPRLVLTLRPNADHVKRCSHCGEPVGRFMM